MATCRWMVFVSLGIVAACGGEDDADGGPVPPVPGLGDPLEIDDLEGVERSATLRIAVASIDTAGMSSLEGLEADNAFSIDLDGVVDDSGSEAAEFSQGLTLEVPDAAWPVSATFETDFEGAQLEELDGFRTWAALGSSLRDLILGVPDESGFDAFPTLPARDRDMRYSTYGLVTSGLNYSIERDASSPVDYVFFAGGVPTRSGDLPSGDIEFSGTALGTVFDENAESRDSSRGWSGTIDLVFDLGSNSFSGTLTVDSEVFDLGGEFDRSVRTFNGAIDGANAATENTELGELVGGVFGDNAAEVGGALRFVRDGVTFVAAFGSPRS
ncbi:MAG: transferrin-binding protein-like solute binding protein [Myxococcota bacterium]